jgi:hypothetical protein
MNWTEFHFSCRFLSQKLSHGLELKLAQGLLSKNYSSHQSCDVLGNPIYKEIVSESSKIKQQELLSVYGNLKLDKDDSSITKLTSLRNYLFLIIAVFLLISGIYKVYVLTSFMEMFSSMGVPMNKQI